MVSFTFVIRLIFINSTKKATCSLQQKNLTSSWWNILYTKLTHYLKIQTEVTFWTQQTGTASNDLHGLNMIKQLSNKSLTLRMQVVHWQEKSIRKHWDSFLYILMLYIYFLHIHYYLHYPIIFSIFCRKWFLLTGASAQYHPALTYFVGVLFSFLPSFPPFCFLQFPSSFSFCLLAEI